ncbi:MAG TPA: hypothetical protein DGL25_01990, partial [Dehalococcoidia bacterium]|nr:hypothetical protein [Dehalococcoidia bacterium]
MIGSYDEKLKKARRGLWRTAILWNPLFVVSAGAGLYFLILQIATSNGVGWIIPVLLFLFSVLLGFQGIQALRDLRGGTVTTAGYITRRWWRFDLGTRSNYLRLGRSTIIRIDRVQYLTVDK